MLLVVDTDVFSFLFRSDSRAEGYRPLIEGHQLALSFQTVAEVYEGALRARWGIERQSRLDSEIGLYLRLPVNEAIVRRWAEVRELRRRQPIGVADAWIAATALSYGAPLVTPNPTDFFGIDDLRLLTHIS